jgi:hypothetical protein
MISPFQAFQAFPIREIRGPHEPRLRLNSSLKTSGNPNLFDHVLSLSLPVPGKINMHRAHTYRRGNPFFLRNPQTHFLDANLTLQESVEFDSAFSE